MRKLQWGTGLIYWMRWLALACLLVGTASSVFAAKTVRASLLNTPLISGLPTSLTFAMQNIGSTSASQSVTLSNTGTTALHIISIAASGDYGVTHNCGAGIGPGGSCALNITFSPTGTGSRSGTFTIVTDGGNLTIPMTGVGLSLSSASGNSLTNREGWHSYS